MELNERLWNINVISRNRWQEENGEMENFYLQYVNPAFRYFANLNLQVTSRVNFVYVVQKLHNLDAV